MILRGFLGSSAPKLRQNICLLIISLYQKTCTQGRPIQKIDFWGPCFGVLPGDRLSKISGAKLRLQLNNVIQKLDFDVLWFRRRAYKIQKEKKTKKEKKTHRGQKWVGRDERVS